MSEMENTTVKGEVTNRKKRDKEALQKLTVKKSTPEPESRIIKMHQQATHENQALLADEVRKQGLIELNESRQTNKIMTSIVAGFEETETLDSSCLVVYYKRIKVIIPLSQLTNLAIPEDRKHFVCTSIAKGMIGSEISFVIMPGKQSIDSENGIAIGSRLRALEIDNAYYIKNPQRNGKYIVNENDIMEGRCIFRSRGMAIIECVGQDKRLKQNDLDYKFIPDVREFINVGERLYLKVLKIDRETGSVAISHKAAKKHPFDEAIGWYHEDSLVACKVVNITEKGVFCVTMNGPEVTIKCNFPGFSNLNLFVGDIVTVKIKYISIEKKFISGFIQKLVKRGI